MKTYFPKYERAVAFALRKHKGQVRKAVNTPYIMHPLEAASIAGSILLDDALLAAVVLHDTLEDTNTKYWELKLFFGKEIADLVCHESEDRGGEKSSSENWIQRKQASLDILKHTQDKRVKIMWLSDKLSNLRSMLNVKNRFPNEDLFGSFHMKDPKMHKWYYQTVLENVSELKDTDAYIEYEETMKKVFLEE